MIGLIWALGGFRPALAGGRTVAVGEPIELARWTVVVERAAYVDTSLAGVQIDPAIRVWLRITNTTAGHSSDQRVDRPTRRMAVRISRRRGAQPLTVSHVHMRNRH